MTQPPEQSPSVGDRGTSQTLLQRLRDNEADAWQRLVRLYGPLVRYWCLRWGLGREDADDVSQEVFHTVAAALQGYRREQAGATFRGWLRGITRNKLLHFLRDNRQPCGDGGTDALLRLQALADDAKVDEEPDPPGELNALYRRALELVRGEFEERTWQAFWHTAVDGRSASDVAADLGISHAAVRKAKSRVLHRLKEELGELIE
jgi:RNA polymerase sigma-70 factor (ECF subfamily)